MLRPRDVQKCLTCNVAHVICTVGGMYCLVGRVGGTMCCPGVFAGFLSLMQVTGECMHAEGFCCEDMSMVRWDSSVQPHIALNILLT